MESIHRPLLSLPCSPSRGLSVGPWVIFAALCLSTTSCAEDTATGQAGAATSIITDVFATLNRGGVTMWALAAILLVGTFTGVAQLAFLTRNKHLPREFEKDVVHMADTKGIDAGIALCREKRSSLGRVLQAALIRHGAPLSQLEASVRNETALTKYVLLRGTRTLGWMTAGAPILGLLGMATNLTKQVDAVPRNGVDSSLQNFVNGIGDGAYCVSFSMVVSLLMLGFYFVTRANALDIAHDIEVKATDAVVTLDRKARQSIRLIEDIEEKIKTESMIKVPDLSADFEESPHAQESAIKTAVTTHAGGLVKE